MSLAIQTIPGLKLADLDDFGGTATMTLTVTQGTITVVAGNSGVSVISGSGVLTTPVVLTGTITNLNKLLTGNSTGTIVYTSSVNGSKTLTISVTDSTGQTGTMSFPITVGPKVAPVVTYSDGTISANQNVAVNVHGASRFSVSDSDAVATLETVTLSIANGVITVASGNSGMQIVSGNGSTSVVLRGTLTSVNALFAGTSSGTITYTGSTNANKTFTVQVVDVDGLSGSNTCTISVGAPPIVTVPVIVAGVQSVALSLKALGFGVTDADDAGGTATCTITTTVGTVTVTAGDSGVGGISGSGTGACSFTGTITQINRLLTNTSATTGTIVGNDASIQTGTITVAVVDSTGRIGSPSCAIKYESSTATWQGFAVATPKALPTGTLTAFPSFVDLSRMPAAWWAVVAPDGRDIRVTNTSNANIARHLVSFNYAAKTGFLVTTLDMATSNNPVRVWVGTALASAPAAGSTYGQNNTYNANIKAFWPDGAGTDATSNANNLTSQNGLSAGDTTGPAGAKSTTYNGTNQYASKSSLIDGGVNASYLTYYKSSQVAGGALMSARESAGANDNLIFIYRQPSATPQMRFRRATVLQSVAPPTSGVTGAFASVALSLASANSVIYDSPNAGQASSVGGRTIPSNTPVTSLGASVASAGQGGVQVYFAGNLACAMILNTAVSQQFADQYQSMLDQSAFWGSWTWDGSGTVTGL